MLQILIFMSLFVSTAFAMSPEVHFFGSIDMARTTTDNDVTYNGIQNRFSASNLDTAGINVSAKFAENSQGLVQVIHSPIPNKFNIDLIQYQRTFANDFKVRLGRQRLPIFLKSEVIQVKALYPWVTPPVPYFQYPIRSFIGGSVEKSWEHSSIQFYTGSIQEELFIGSTRIDVQGSDLYGLRLNYNNDSFESFVNFLSNKSNSTIYAEAPINSSVNGQAKIPFNIRNGQVVSTGVSYDTSHWLMMSEFLHIWTTNTLVRTTDSAYGSLGYRFTEKFLVLATYANEFNRSSGFAPSSLDTYDLTLNYSLDDNTSLKFGFTHVNVESRTKTSVLAPAGTDGALGLSGSAGGNFDVYDLQLAFVF